MSKIDPDLSPFQGGSPERPSAVGRSNGTEWVLTVPLRVKVPVHCESDAGSRHDGGVEPSVGEQITADEQ